jgi:AraC family transcriptional regulator
MRQDPSSGGMRHEASMTSGALGPEPVLRSRSGLRVDLHTHAAGLIELAALPDHRLLIHAGAPVRGSCGHQRYTYTRGDVDIIPAGQSDACHHEQNSTSLVVRLAPTLLRQAAEDLGVDPDRTSLEPRYQLRDPQIEHIAWALDAERKSGHPGGALYADSLGLALALHLIRRFPAPARKQAGLSPAQLERVTTYIDARIDRDLSMQRLASVAQVSASHLKNAFRRSTGLPVHEYVVQRRVERAKALLLRGELPASQIALEAGFAHQSHMARCMRRVLGVTPGAFTRQGSRGRTRAQA